MSTVLAAIDDSLAARPVLMLALAVAPMLDSHVEALHVTEDGGRTAGATAEALAVPLREAPGDIVEQIARAAIAPEVRAIVIGSRGRPGGRRPAGHVATALMARIERPLVVVPPAAEPPAHLGRVLVAMVGKPDATRGLDWAIEVAARAELEIVVVHVDDESSIPRFSDQAHHETDAYATEFLARYCCDQPTVRLESRVGSPVEEVLRACDELHPDLLAVGWRRNLSPGRATVAFGALERGHTPVLLVPLDVDAPDTTE